MNKSVKVSRVFGGRLFESVRSAGTAALEFLYPPSCFICNGDLSGSISRDQICSSCLTQISFEIDANRCRRCGEPLGPHLNPEEKCSQCKDKIFAFERVMRWGVYDEMLREACVRGKHAGGSRIVGTLARIAAPRLLQQLGDDTIDLVLPIPQHWRQRIIRPHNSAEILAREWSLILGKPFSIRFLRKARFTKKQVGLSSTERQKNLRDAFRARLPRKFQGSTVLLVDDIITTGSTAHQASRALRTAGAGRVIVAVLAYSRYSR